MPAGHLGGPQTTKTLTKKEEKEQQFRRERKKREILGPHPSILAQDISDRTTCCFRTLWQVIQFFLSCCFCGKTLFHATQGMERDGCSRWVGPGSPWTTAQISSVADGIRSQVRRINSSRELFGVDGVNRVFGPRL